MASSKVNSVLKYTCSLIVIISILWTSCNSSVQNEITDVLVIGAGTGATTAAIQSARSGASTILLNPIEWLGGMTTAAGVSATDGNHQLPAGLWGEFRDTLRTHYGGTDSLFTGWVSNTMFEPKVGDYYWKQIAINEPKLTIHYNIQLDTIIKENELWKVIYYNNDTAVTTYAKILIDGTDLGDIAAMLGATYDVGMDARHTTGEEMAPELANDIIQDMTYAAILEDYGPTVDMTISRPIPYDASQFYCSCEKLCNDSSASPHPCLTMINYGKLPNEKYMINWPLKGNDYYTNIIDLNKDERQVELKKAKQKTLQFIYFIQNELGYKHLGIAKDEFPTEDGLPLMPYHREGRRVHGLTQLNINSIINPYSDHLYRTGIAVGDYPIDHHHFERTDAPEIDFPMVPSFSIPIGSLIPKNMQNLILADKSISVTNIVNGASRLQPVIIQVGQVAGLMAALSAVQHKPPHELDIRDVQQHLLESNGYLMPYIDIKPTNPSFESIQRVGASGLLRGNGIPYKWANQTWFYPDSIITQNELYQGLQAYYGEIKIKANNSVPVTLDYLIESIVQIEKQQTRSSLEEILQKSTFTDAKTINRWKESKALSKVEVAIILDILIKPFGRSIDIRGNWKK